MTDKGLGLTKELTEDIMDKITELLSNLEDGDLLPSRNKIYILMSLAASAIAWLDRENARLRKANSDMRADDIQS